MSRPEAPVVEELLLMADRDEWNAHRYLGTFIVHVMKPGERLTYDRRILQCFRVHPRDDYRDELHRMQHWLDIITRSKCRISQDTMSLAVTIERT